MGTATTDFAVRASALAKRYRLDGQSHGKTIREALTKTVGRLVTRKPAPASDRPPAYVWALHGVDLSIPRGEVIGLIGPNGGGKSTFLKIVAGITEPTAGRAEVRGRVSPLLEVGTGFHPELTGRENVYLNGAILGMKQAEVRRKFDEIVAFAEVEPFIDTPVKRYSSGMQVRLAFAVAAHLEPEILLVDEVLAVGDAAFQAKCLGRMSEVTREGRTIVFVSHDMSAVARLCSRAVYVARGRVEFDGPASDAIDTYLSGQAATHRVWLRPADAEIHEAIYFTELAVPSVRGQLPLRFADPIEIRATYRVLSERLGTVLAIRIVNASGVTVLTSWNSDRDPRGDEALAPGEYVSVCHLPGAFLPPGRYYVSVTAFRPGFVLYESLDGICSFEISASSYLLNADRRGVIAPLLPWTTERLSDGGRSPLKE